MEITAEMVKKLRDLTGAGMMDAKSTSRLRQLDERHDPRSKACACYEKAGRSTTRPDRHTHMAAKSASLGGNSSPTSGPHRRLSQPRGESRAHRRSKPQTRRETCRGLLEREVRSTVDRGSPEKPPQVMQHREKANSFSSRSVFSIIRLRDRK